MPSCIKPLLEPILTQIFVATWCHHRYDLMVNIIAESHDYVSTSSTDRTRIFDPNKIKKRLYFAVWSCLKTSQKPMFLYISARISGHTLYTETYKQNGFMLRS